jgi:glutathione S-transferase
MDQHLAKRDWFVGDSITLADIALYAYSHVANAGGFEMKQYPAIGRWLDRVAAQPNYVPIA